MCSNKLLDKKVITQPFEEPVALEGMKLYMGVDYDEKNMLIQGLIVAARELLEEKYDIGIVKKTIRAVVDNSCGGIEITGAPIGDVSGFNEQGDDVDLQIVGSDHKYIQSPCSCYLEVEYESGYELIDVPTVFINAIKEQVLWMFENLGDAETIDKVCPMAAMSLKPFRRNGTGVFI